MEILDRTNIQALVLAPYKDFGWSCHLLFKIGIARGGREFLGELAGMITHGGLDLKPSDDALLNIGLTWRGLVALEAFEEFGGSEAAREQFYIFNEDPDPESLRLSRAQGPPTWWNGQFGTSDIHLSIHIFAATEVAREAKSRRVRSLASERGLTELKPTRDGSAITGRTMSPSGRQLHFGYQDGISHPKVNWDKDPSRGDLYSRNHFLLGESTDDVQSGPNRPPFDAFVRHGTYMALAWIYQDVARFNRFLREEGPRLAPDRPPEEAEEWLAAKLMGRWRSGTPLALSPDRDDPSLTVANDFAYGDDPAGLKCPFAAHIRIVNGRDQPLNDRNASMFGAGFPRVLRRGTPYGPPLEGEADDGQDRGTLGLFLCANLNKQFYGLTRWIGQTNFSDVYDDHRGQDPLVADRGFAGAHNTFSIPTNAGTKTISGLPNFVRLQGVAFLFLPTISTLRRIAAPGSRV